MDRELLGANVQRVRERIASACTRAGRRTDDVLLIAITKYVGPDVIAALSECAITDCGENRVLEGIERIAQVGPHFRWHFVGHLQTNKVKRAIGPFAIFHSIDRWDLAAELEKHAKHHTMPTAGFVQVNVSGEGTKGGATPDETPRLVERIRRECRSINLCGLMTMAPHAESPEASRPHFRKLRELRDRCGLVGLSMGMTADFEVAVEEGATHVRVGSALFEGVGS